MKLLPILVLATASFFIFGKLDSKYLLVEVEDELEEDDEGDEGVWCSYEGEKGDEGEIRQCYTDGLVCVKAAMMGGGICKKKDEYSKICQNLACVHPDSECVHDTYAKFKCQCKSGYEGDGRLCAKTLGKTGVQGRGRALFKKKKKCKKCPKKWKKQDWQDWCKSKCECCKLNKPKTKCKKAKEKNKCKKEVPWPGGSPETTDEPDTDETGVSTEPQGQGGQNDGRDDDDNDYANEEDSDEK